jgi:hypothetical protein
LGFLVSDRNEPDAWLGAGGLLRLFSEANIQAVFIGIESPNLASLEETKKMQNTREGPLFDRVKKRSEARH